MDETARGRLLRVLLVQASAADSEPVLAELRKSAYRLEISRVSTAAGFSAAIGESRWDLVISDDLLPAFSAREALDRLRQAAVDVPFFVISSVIGEQQAIELMRAGAHDLFTPDNLARMVPAIERELVEARSRELRRAAERDQALLARASAALISSLDTARTLETVMELVVPELADWCSIDLVEPSGGFARAAWKHADPAKARIMAELRERFPGRADRPNPSLAPLRRGEPWLIREVTPELLEQLAKNHEHRLLLRQAGIRSAIVVPLKVRDSLIGVLSVASAGSGRIYDDHDVELFEELAWRLSAAIDNSRLYREIQESVRARDEFIRIASHELKTPLTSLKLQTQRFRRELRHGGAEQVDPRRVESLLELTDRQVTRLNGLVDDMLAVSTLAEGKLELKLERADLAELARLALERLDGALKQAGCEAKLTIEGPAVGDWDPARIEQVIASLVSNVIKYAPGKPFEIAIGAGSKAWLEVRDRGIGISPERQERIFDRFERAVSASETSGFGLGLYISRRIVEAHGGTLRVWSRPGQGSVFRVELPASVPAEKQEPMLRSA